MTQPNKLTIVDVDNIILGAKNAQKNPAWKDVGTNIENIAQQLADTMRENERLRQNLMDYEMALTFAPAPVSREWIDQLNMRINRDRQELSKKDSDNG